MARIKNKAQSSPTLSNKKRPYLRQADVPSASLDEALRIPQAILDHYAGKPTTPFHVAKALNIDPKGSQIRLLSGAGIAFGLIEGGAQAAAMSVTDLARKILRPTTEEANREAKREAVLKPRVFGEFLRRYDGHAFPREDLAQNVLEEMGVPRKKTAEVLARILESAESVSFVEEINGKTYITLQDAAASPDSVTQGDEDSVFESNLEETTERNGVPLKPLREPPTIRSRMASAIIDDERRRRVFITHGKNRDLVEPIRKLLEYGELEPMVSVERQSVSKPVPEKVMDDMRGCGAAIIHVDADRTITDQDGKNHVLLNPNVLIEIGAAMAFYGRRFVLLVREGVTLPSNLQGLYEVRYQDRSLDAAAAIRLLEAIKDIKNYSLPTESDDDDN